MEYPASTFTLNDQITIESLIRPETTGEIVTQIYRGLTADQKYISSRFFYDSYGSELFEDITHLPEYYPTRTEISILKKNASQLLHTLNEGDLIELGSGDCTKISVLLDALPSGNLDSMRYIPVDISKTAIFKSARLLSQKYPRLTIHGMHADFIHHLTSFPEGSKRMICFFGSTLGNFSRDAALQFLLDLKEMMEPGDELLLGLDMVKDKEVLEDAYNDKEGITAAFNKNILRSVNRYAKTDLDPDLFDHLAFYNEEKERIEMHLKARADMEISSAIWPDEIHIHKGETLHTENSHKYSKEHILCFSETTGWKIADIYTDTNQWFSLVHFINN